MPEPLDNPSRMAYVSHMRTNTAIRFSGRRAFRFDLGSFRWMPIAADRARLMIATGTAQDVTGTEAATL